MTYEMFQQGASVYVPVILISLIITMAVYCAFPLIFAKARKAEITKKKYNLLCYGINILLCLTFAFINGGATSFLPYLIWTCVFSNLGIKIMKRKGIIADVQSTDPASPTPSKSIETKATINIDSEEPSTFVNEIQGLKGNVTEAPKDKKSYKTVSIVLTVALVTSVISIFGIVEILNYTKDNLDYLSSNAVFVTETGNKYHRYNCDILGARSYWIYNIELAESMGYEPCSECWPSYDGSNEESSRSYLGEIVNDEDIEKAKEIENERYNYVAKEIRDFKKTIGEEEIEKFKHKEEDQSDSVQTSFSGSAVRSLKRAIGQEELAKLKQNEELEKTNNPLRREN